MSALGDYVHLRKYNYERYGILKSKNGSQIEEGNTFNSQYAYWNMRVNKTKELFERFSAVPDPVEEQLNKEMSGLTEFMKALQEGKTAEDKRIKTEILNKVLKDTCAEMVNINFATGMVSSAGDFASLQGFLTGSSTAMIKKMANNQMRVQIKDEQVIKQGYFNVKKYLSEILDDCNKFYKILAGEDGKSKKGRLPKESIKAMRKRYASIEKLLNSVKEDIKKVENQLEIKGNTENFKYIDLMYTNARWVANDLMKIINELKVPNLSSIKGSLMEYLLLYYAEHGTKVAGNEVIKLLETACKQIGTKTTSGHIGELTVEPNVAAALKNFRNKKTGLKLDATYDEGNRDIITGGTLEYNYDSERKADVRVNVTVESTREEIKDIGISVKNYLANDIGLVSGSPLYTFLLGGEYTIDEVNHLLNIQSSFYSSNDKEDDSNEDKRFTIGMDQHLKEITTESIKLSILYSALTGDLVGKGADNKADYILLNRPDKGGAPMIVSANRLIANIIKNYNTHIRFEIANGAKNNSFTLLNDRVPAVDGDNWTAAGKRIANLITQLHQIKVSASIPKAAITSLGLTT